MAGGAFCDYNRNGATKEIPIATPTRRTTVMAACLLVACSAPPPSTPPPYAAREVVTLGRWLVRSEGNVVGQVVQLEIRDPSGPIRFYRVQDTQGRWLGHATEAGRFSRRVPFQDDDQDLGVYGMARGVALLFDASAPVQLEAVAVDAVAAPGSGRPQ